MLVMWQDITGRWRQFLKKKDVQIALQKGNSTAFVWMDAINDLTITSFIQTD